MASFPPSLLDVDATANRQPKILRATIPFIVLAYIAVILRFRSRRLKRTAIAADDFTIVAGVVFNTCIFIVTGLAVHYGSGKHLIAVPPSNYSALLKLFLAFEIFYTTTISITKVSILLFYRRIFATPIFRNVTNVVGFFVLAWFVAVILVSIFSCVPVNGYWNHTVPATCIDSRSFYLGISIANILTDVIVLALPVPMVWHLQSSRSQKAALTFAFGLGGFVVVVSSVRIAFVLEVGPDFTWDYTNPLIWSDIETSMAVVSACLPTLRPIAQYAASGLSSIKLRSQGRVSERAHQLQIIPKNASSIGPSRDRNEYSELNGVEKGPDAESVVPTK